MLPPGLAFVVFALGAALVFAVSSRLKHRVAQSEPQSPPVPARSRSALGQVVAATVRHPLWLVALLADAAGVVLQAMALHLGPLSVVQPLLSVSLVFALLLGGAARPRRELLGWSVALVAAVALLAALSGTATRMTTGTVAHIDRIPAVIAGVAAAVVILAALLAGRRGPTGRLPAIAFGLASGVAYAVSAALVKGLLDQWASHGVVGVVLAWQLYAVAVVGPAGMTLAQLAFRAGPLEQSLPAASAVDPLLSIVLGVGVFDESLQGGVLGHVGLAGALALLVIAVGRLAAGTVQGDREAQRVARDSRRITHDTQRAGREPTAGARR